MIDAIIFDKDGTLFDFQKTWTVPFARLLDEVAPELQSDAALAMGFDTQAGQFHPGSMIIASTTGEVAEELKRFFGGDLDETIARLNAAGAGAIQAPAVDLRPCLKALAAKRYLGLVTNDSETPARKHLAQENIVDLFTFIAGWDSGYGAKPEPGQLLAFCDVTGIAPDATVMVGDSRHDLIAGRAAGMGTVGVLTGVAGEAELADLADVVLPDIGHLETWLETATA